MGGWCWYLPKKTGCLSVCPLLYGLALDFIRLRSRGRACRSTRHDGRSAGHRSCESSDQNNQAIKPEGSPAAGRYADNGGCRVDRDGQAISNEDDKPHKYAKPNRYANTHKHPQPHANSYALADTA